jgi:penicillin V acylase-like amidase (Ntn superfamily)
MIRVCFSCLGLCLFSSLTLADTDFILSQPTDPAAAKTVVSARNFDSEINLGYFAEVMPRGRVWHSTNPDAATGKFGWIWTNQYGYVGISQSWALNYNQGHDFDGMNERGLSAALLEYDYSNGLFPEPAVGHTNLSVLSVVAWVLGNFATVSEVTNAIGSMHVWQEPSHYFLRFSNSLQLVVHDTNSQSAVIEWFHDGTIVRGPDWVDPYRSVAGDPEYATLTSYAENYADLNWTNHMKLPVSNEMVRPADHYLPGDSWSPSRFVRANRLVSTVVDSYSPLPMKTEYPPAWRLQNADHILRRLEIVPGERKRFIDSPSGAPAYCTTLSLLRDHSHKDLIFRGIYDPNLKKIHVEQLDFINQPDTPPWMELDPPPNDALVEPAFDLTGPLISGDAHYYLYAFCQYLELNVKINVSGAPGDLTSGHMYIFSQKTNGSYYAWTGSGWTGAIALTNLPACHSGALSTRTFNKVFDDYVDSGIGLGTRVYAGYGLSPLEMMMSQRCKLVHIVSDPHYVVYKVEEP